MKYWDKFIPAVRDVTKKVLAGIARRDQEDYTYLVVPVFSVTGITFNTSSEITAKFAYAFSNKWALLLPIQKPSANPNYCLCVSWLVGGVVQRFKLWQGVGEVLGVPLYAGRSIEASFTLEVWNISTSNTQSQATPYKLCTTYSNARTTAGTSVEVDVSLVQNSNLYHTSTPLPLPVTFNQPRV